MSHHDSSLSLDPWDRNLLSVGRTPLGQDCSNMQGLPQQTVMMGKQWWKRVEECEF